VGVGRRRRAGREIDFDSDQRLARNVGNGRLEVLRDGYRFAIMGGYGPAIEKASAAQVASMMIRIFMGSTSMSLSA
jgi:hypothetical protein